MSKPGNVAYDTADNQKPHDHLYIFPQPGSILTHDPFHRDVPEEFETDEQIENGAHSDRSKEASDQALLSPLHLPDLRVQSIYYRDTLKQEDEYPEADETPDGDYLAMCERRPWTHGAEPREDGVVEQHIGRLL